MTQLVSIIVPVYNTGDKFRRCIESLINQTYKTIEVILVDDGSTDGTEKLCDLFAEKDNRIRVFHKRCGGVSAARNFGIDNASGEYITFSDHDDYNYPTKIEKMLSCIVNEKVDICACQWQYEKSDGTCSIDQSQLDNSIFGVHSTIEFEEYIYQSGYSNGMVVAVWNKLYCRKVFNGIRFAGYIIEDEDLNDRINAQNYSVCVINDTLYHWVQRDESLSNQVFSTKNFRHLDVILQRIQLFKENTKIKVLSQKLYCELYIEFYFKAKNAGVTIPRQYYINFVNVILASIKDISFVKMVGIKFFARMIVFLISPHFYKYITRKKTEL